MFMIYCLRPGHFYTIAEQSKVITDNSNADYAVTQSLVRTDHDQPESPTDATQGYSKLDSEVDDNGESTQLQAVCTQLPLSMYTGSHIFILHQSTQQTSCEVEQTYIH